MKRHQEDKVEAYIVTAWEQIKDLQMAALQATKAFKEFSEGQGLTTRKILEALSDAATAAANATAELRELTGYSIAMVEENLP